MEVRLPYQGIGVGTTRTFIRDNPDVVRRYVKSQVEAVHRLKTDREAGIRVLGKYLNIPDREVLERAYDDAITDEKFPPKQYPSLEGIKRFSNRWRRRTQKRKPRNLRTLSICASSRNWTTAVSSTSFTRAGSGSGPAKFGFSIADFRLGAISE